MASELSKVVVLYCTVKPHVEYCAWFSGKREKKKTMWKMLINLTESSSGPPRWAETSALWQGSERTGPNSGLPLGGYFRYGTRLFTEVHRLKTKDNDHMVRQEGLPNDIKGKIFFLWGWLSDRSSFVERVWIFLSLKVWVGCWAKWLLGTFPMCYSRSNQY